VNNRNSDYVSGATLVITNQKGDVIVPEFVTDSLGAVDISETFVMDTVYVLHEVSAPDGYIPAEDIRFKFDSNGSLYLQ
jgi:uncharacterized surface anchored protein